MDSQYLSMDSQYLRRKIWFNYQNTDPNYNYKLFVLQDDFDPSIFLAKFTISQLPFEAISLQYGNYDHSFINIRDNYERLINNWDDEIQIYDSLNNEKVHLNRFLAPYRAEYYTFQSNSYYSMKIRRVGFDIHKFMNNIIFTGITPHDEYLTLISHPHDYDIEKYKDSSFDVEVNYSILLKYKEYIIFMDTSTNTEVDQFKTYFIRNVLKRGSHKSVLERLGFPSPHLKPIKKINSKTPLKSSNKINRKTPLQSSKKIGGKRKHLNTRKRS
jgi:hypothetical protein